MRLCLQACVSVLLWNYLLACEPCLRVKSTQLVPIEYEIINLNDKQMNVSWDAKKNMPGMNVTMFYKFYDFSEEFKECPQYKLDEGINTGCLFKTEGEHLEISIRDANRSKEFYFDQQNVRQFFKPNPPENITFQWAHDIVMAQYNPPEFPPPDLLDFELEYKSMFDSEWQGRINPCCKITVPGFDPEKCYIFRFRLKMSGSCSPCYASEWGPEMHWKNGSFGVSCITDVSKEPQLNTIIVLVSAMAVFLVIFTILVCVCSLERIRKTVMPAIPDPKHMYAELFSDHNGNFQDWIRKTENVLVDTKLEYGEECIVEENVQEPTLEVRVGIKKLDV